MKNIQKQQNQLVFSTQKKLNKFPNLYKDFINWEDEGRSYDEVSSLFPLGLNFLRQGLSLNPDFTDSSNLSFCNQHGEYAVIKNLLLILGHQKHSHMYVICSHICTLRKYTNEHK